MKAVCGSLVWLALYAIVSLATTCFSHLFQPGRAVRGLMLIRRTQAGAEPVGGDRFAAIGRALRQWKAGLL